MTKKTFENKLKTVKRTVSNELQRLPVTRIDRPMIKIEKLPICAYGSAGFSLEFACSQSALLNLNWAMKSLN